MARNPNSYVPPAARKAPGGFAAAAARGATASTGSKLNGKPTPTGTQPAASSTPAPPAAVPIATSASNNPALPATTAAKLEPPPAAPARTTSDGPAEGTAKKTSPLPEKLGLPAAPAMAKTESKVRGFMIHVCFC